MNYYVLNSENEIALFDTDKKRLQTTLKFKPELADEKIHQTTKEIVELDGKFVFADEHQEEIDEEIAREDLAKEEASQNYTEAVTLLAKTYTPVIQFKAIEGQYLASGADKFRIYQNGELIAENSQFIISETGAVSIEAYSSTAGDFIINVRRI